MLKKIALAFGIWLIVPLISAQVGPTVFTPQLTVSPGPLTVTTGLTTVEDIVINGTCTGCTATPAGGNTTEIQYNNAGAFAGSSTFTYNLGTDTVTLTNLGADVVTANTGVIAPILSSPSALALIAGGANNASISTNGTTRLSIGSDGDWLVDGSVGTAGQVLTSNGTGAVPSWETLGSVSSVGLSMPAGFSVTNSPVTTTGTLTVGYATGQTANRFLATPDGSAGALSLRAIATGDLPAAVALTSAANVFSTNSFQRIVNTAAGGDTLRLGGTGAGGSDPFLSFYDSSNARHGYIQLTAADLRIDSDDLSLALRSNDTTRMLATVAGAITFPNNTGFTLPSGATLNGTAICLSNGTNCPTVTTTTGSGAVTGCTTTPNFTTRLSRSGSSVTLVMEGNQTCTSNTTALTVANGAVPSGYRPVVTVNCSVRIADNSGNVLGNMSIDTAGAITFGVAGASGGFTAAGFKGTPTSGGGPTCSYPVN